MVHTKYGKKKGIPNEDVHIIQDIEIISNATLDTDKIFTVIRKRHSNIENEQEYFEQPIKMQNINALVLSN